MGLNNISSTDNVVVTCGSTEAMMAAMMAVCNPRDKVVVFSPYYENYAIDAILSGADPIFVPLKQPDFNFDANELEDAFKQNAKALILCNPSNPSGKVFTREELEIIASLAKKYNAYVICCPDIFPLHAQQRIKTRAGNARGARADNDHPHRGNIASRQLAGIDQRRAGNDG